MNIPRVNALEYPAPHPWVTKTLLLETQAQVLDSLGWERVDIFNAEGMSPYKDLVVASEWLNSEGADIVRHIVDTAPNKFDEEPREEPEEEQEQEQEGSEDVVEDLISGLDDDGA